jgi:4-hydroxybenzoate polyprenyltransferase
LKAGIKSTALRFGKDVKRWLTGFAIGTITCLGVAGFMNRQTYIYFAGVGGAAWHLFHQLKQINASKVCNAGKLFKMNVLTGYVVLGGLMADLTYQRCVKRMEEKDEE